jgi:hypothetical protein
LGQAATATRSGDLVGVLNAIGALEDGLSPACWTAVNYPVDPAVQLACSSTELNILASASRKLLSAYRALLTSGDFSPLMQVSLNLANTQLSRVCAAALQQAQNPYQQQWKGGMALPGVSNVYDHGGGTYSVPGVGACTPSGCMAF